MTKQATALNKREQAFKSSTKARTARVFSISLKGIPQLDTSAKARLEAAARDPAGKRRDYPQLTIE
ncbi:MAG: hypothetical protein JF606_25630 [Burkholderiales bacterium]|jgi:hypothetical protein|nr:hypothetical protein [Burkholderiales bacterium]